MNTSNENSYALSLLVTDFERAWENPSVMKDLLMDYYPNDKLLRNLLYASVEEHIPHDLYLSQSYSKEELYRYSKRLVDGYGCNKRIANEIVELWVDALRIEKPKIKQHLTREQILDLSMEELDLSVRAYNSMKRAGIDTVRDLVTPREEGMMGVRNLGRKSIEEVFEKLKELGFEFKQNIEDGERGSTKEYPGHEKCHQLRGIRNKIAIANDIPYEPTECNHEGPCIGTCPVCDAEVKYLEEELQKKIDRGERIILDGIAETDIKRAQISLPENRNDTLVMGQANIEDLHIEFGNNSEINTVTKDID